MSKSLKKPRAMLAPAVRNRARVRVIVVARDDEEKTGVGEVGIDRNAVAAMSTAVANETAGLSERFARPCMSS